MKSEQEIRDEIEFLKENVITYDKDMDEAFNEVLFNAFRDVKLIANAEIVRLKWVLDER